VDDRITRMYNVTAILLKGMLNFSQANEPDVHISILVSLVLLPLIHSLLALPTRYEEQGLCICWPSVCLIWLLQVWCWVPGRQEVSIDCRTTGMWWSNVGSATLPAYVLAEHTCVVFFIEQVAIVNIVCCCWWSSLAFWEPVNASVVNNAGIITS